MAQNGALTIDGTRVPVSNLDKVLYPAAGFTKAQVIDFYIRVAGYLLPHLHDRPVTLKRYPDGISGEHFYEKDAPSYTPQWVKTFPVPRRSGESDIRYILINDLRTLVWCANLANLEIHPFLHRVPDIDRPTHVVFDLDPGEGADLMTCAEVSLWLKEALDALTLSSFAKVSGSKGMQVYVPLNTAADYPVTQSFARGMAQWLEREHKARVVSEMPKHLRAGKVFVDWSQNSDFKTTVGVYSLRAKRHHPYISMPVTWDEIASARDADELTFTPEEALERLDETGDLFEPVLTLRQKLPGTERLQAYTAKRNFKKTPEPSGAAAVPRRSKQGSRRRFVIQKHAASHLHFDFRLEMHDVLKSWAVPKGVPHEAGQRRLAAATEDHPLEYIDFEGNIPKGQYGGGTVMVWDIGTYELMEGNYYKGKLHIFLNGSKLKGEYLLEKDRGQDKNWRVVRMSSDGDAPDHRSVLTGRTIEEIASDKASAHWSSNRTNAGIDLDALPKSELKFIEPMQADPANELPEGEQWSYEVKFDGYRALAIRTAEGVQLLSRRANLLNDRFRSIIEALDAAEPGTIFDGEVMALDAEGRPSFNVLQNYRSPTTPLLYYVFDLVAYRGRSLANLALSDRRLLLEMDAMQPLASPVLLSVSLKADPEQLLQAAREQRLEGIVAKRSNSLYETGKRSGAWVKVRVSKGQELVVGGYKPAASGFEYLLVGYYEGDKLNFIAKLKNGFTPQTKKQIVARFPKLKTEKCPFDNLPEPKNARRGEAVTAEVMKSMKWLRPELVVQVDFVDWTEANHLRHAKFVAIRDDKDAREVVKES